jgi:anaerobic magnesium-protoporphyrin IX monomethyl ester cyclase
MKKMDVLFVNANSSEINYQQLAEKFSAIETPIWAGMLANHVRTRGFSTRILDCEAERLDTLDSAKRIIDAQARLVVFVVQGQNPNDSTPKMEGCTATSKIVKQIEPSQKILFVGPHVAALPRETLALEDSIDFIAQNEGVYTLSNLLKLDNFNDEMQLSKVKGLGYRTREFQSKKSKLSILTEESLYENSGIILNETESLVSKELLSTELPGIAWDLLPPPTKYRTSSWHSWTNNTEQSPFASLYTSLGCPYQCSFCMINILNRTDNSPGIVSADSNVYRQWNPDFMITQFDKLAEMGVKNIKIADELFVLNKNYFLKLSKLLKERNYGFNIWCYSRVDTCKKEYLEPLKEAGVNWLALGIENPDQVLRRDFVKGGFKEVRILDLMKEIQDAGIAIGGNYIFGLPPDTMESMQNTLKFALENFTEYVNFYPSQALPGSPLHQQAKQKGWKLPDRYAGYAMLSYHTENLRSDNLTGEQILKFRDDAYDTYWSNEQILKKMKSKFGDKCIQNLKDTNKIKLKRKILGD